MIRPQPIIGTELVVTVRTLVIVFAERFIEAVPREPIPFAPHRGGPKRPTGSRTQMLRSSSPRPAAPRNQSGADNAVARPQ
jgi:hypothetical protein